MIRHQAKLKLCTAGCILLVSLTTASACLWIMGTTLQGHPKEASGIGAARRLHIASKQDLHEKYERIRASLHGTTNFNERSDVAVSLVFAGKFQESVDLLQTLEAEHPGTYFVAANLGTALELLGKNDEALHWIREGIRRNPQSHDGTEWLHAKVLEAKIAQEKDAEYFKKHSVLDLKPQQISKVMTIDGQEFSADQVGKAIQYQLEERLQFVKPPDPAVASLLFDYAAIEAATKILESAEGLLKMALEYGYPADQVQAQMNLYDRKITQRKFEQYGMYCFFAAAAIGILVLLYKKGIFVLSSKDIGAWYCLF